jgi:hypothetical protein
MVRLPEGASRLISNQLAEKGFVANHSVKSVQLEVQPR